MRRRADSVRRAGRANEAVRGREPIRDHRLSAQSGAAFESDDRPAPATRSNGPSIASRGKIGWAQWSLSILWLFLVTVAPMAHAQVLPFDQYSNGQGNSGPNVSQQFPNGNPRSGGMASPGQGASAYDPGGGSFQGNAPLGEFTPTPIITPNLNSEGPQPESGTTLVPLMQPPTAGATPAPLFARPGVVPGQFELFQRPPPQVSEFENFVKTTVGRPLPRFGSSLVLNGGRGFALGPTATVPPDYALNPGDELIIGVTGSVEANLRLVIDSEGRVFIPRIGPVNVAGVRYGDLAAALTRRFNEQYKQAKVSVVIGRLHGLTVYVTGYAVSPGAYTVSSLSTMVDAVLSAGGPSAGGSFRTIELRRNGQLINTLDLYDLLLKGDKSHDAVLQNEDVLNIDPAGPELAIVGSVNAEAIYEAKPGDTLGDVVRYAGGPNSLADDSRAIVMRLGDLDAAGSRQVSFAEAKTLPAERGEIVRILSLAGIARPLERQAILATISGEVDRPGRYYLSPSSTVSDLLARAGGLTSGAFVFGTELDRESVRRQQQTSFDRAIDDLELAVAAAPLSALGSPASASSTGGVADTASATRLQASLDVIDRLKQRKPDGRVILALEPNATAIPGNLQLEDDDTIFIPPRPKTVGVFGAVYRPGSFLFGSATRISGYLKLAGGPQKYADRNDIFVVRANGAVVSRQQDRGFAGRAALPGDVVFVPVRTSPTALQRLLEIANIVFQFGVGVATVRLLTQ